MTRKINKITIAWKSHRSWKFKCLYCNTIQHREKLPEVIGYVCSNKTFTVIKQKY